ncbi:MAG: histidine phosphatase family protein [Paracoccaceae bacterium]
MTTNWWWVRHGPTHEKAFLGWRDVPADLSDRSAIARLDGFLPKGAVLVSSDLIRAVATADVVGAGRERLPHANELREFNFGDWDGLSFEEVAKRDPEKSREFWEAPGMVAPPNGESWQGVAARIAPFVVDMNTRFRGRDIVAVAHIGVIMTQIGMAAGMDPTQAIGHAIDNLSVTRMQWDGATWDIGKINHNP